MAYATWRERIKAYIIGRPLDPSRLTKSDVDSIISFARGLSPVKERIELIKREHHAHGVWEPIQHLKIPVKDSAKNSVRYREGPGEFSLARPHLYTGPGGVYFG